MKISFHGYTISKIQAPSKVTSQFSKLPELHFQKADQSRNSYYVTVPFEAAFFDAPTTFGN